MNSQHEVGQNASSSDSKVHLNEVAPIGGVDQPAWIEIKLSGERIFLPIMMKPNNALSAATHSGASETGAFPYQKETVGGTSLEGWSLSDMDGNTYVLPAAASSIPPTSILRIVFGEGIDDLDFSDWSGTLYVPDLPGDMLDEEGDQLALFDPTGTMVSFLAWGVDPGEDASDAVAAGVWEEGAYHIFYQGFGDFPQLAPGQPNASIGLWNDGWHSYFAKNSSPGRENPPPAPLGSNLRDGAMLASSNFGVTWTGVLDEVTYEFELATDEEFMDVIVHQLSSDVGWIAEEPLPDGDYFWRARILTRDGQASAYIGPMKISSVFFDMEELEAFSSSGMASSVLSPATSNAPVLKQLLSPDKHFLQRKDTTMLDIGKGAPNKTAKNGSPRTGTRHRWDGPHVSNDIDKFPTFSWNGYDNVMCARASAAMIAAYYGGNLSIDRINFYLFETLASNNDPTKGSPEGDMGWGIGASSKTALEWALHGASLSSLTFCPENENEDVDYCLNKENPGSSIDFVSIKILIDAGKPFLASIPGHARVVDGYCEGCWGKNWVRVLDPVPVGAANCEPGKCSGITWKLIEDFQAETTWIGFLPGLENTPNVRNDEPFIHTDTDGDGINDFDEWMRFYTSIYNKDSDGDGIDDKTEIVAYTFNQDGSYRWLFTLPADLGDPDTLRKERDIDNDDDGTPDGCEDRNKNGFLDSYETSNFAQDGVGCVPSFNILQPTSGAPQHIGPANDPNNFWIVLDTNLPWNYPSVNFNKSDFTVRVQHLSNQFVWGELVILDMLKSPDGKKVGLYVKPPSLALEGKYHLSVETNIPTYYGSIYSMDAQYVSVIAGPKQKTKMVLTIDNSSSGGGGDKWLAKLNATNLLLSQFSPGNSLGLVSLGGMANTLLPLSEIVDARDLDPIRVALNSLTLEPESDLLGGLELARQNLSTVEDDRAFIFAGISGAPDLTAPPTLSVFGDLNFDGQVDGLDGATSVYSDTRILVTGLGDGTQPWMTGAGYIASATLGNFMFAPDVSEPDLPTSLSNRLADAYKSLAEQALGEQRILEEFGILDPTEDVILTVFLDSATSIAFTSSFSDILRGDLRVLRPSGDEVLPSDGDVEHHQTETHEHFRVSNPTPGLWAMVLQNVAAGGEPTEYIAFASADTPLELDFVDASFVFSRNPSTPVIQIKATLINGDDRIPGATISAAVFQPDGSLAARLILVDNGMNGDYAAGDGIYTSQPYEPEHEGAYLVKIEASGVDDAGQNFARYTQVSSVFRKPVAYVYNAESDGQTLLDFADLLKQANLFLVNVHQNLVNEINWNFFSGMIIAPDSAEPSNWGSASQRTTIQSTGLPILGLGSSGAMLFSDLGLNLGTNLIVSDPITLTTPVDNNDLLWFWPFGLGNAAPPYEIYSESAATLIDLPVAAPPAGVEPLGLDPETSYYVIATENLHYAIWGFHNGPAWMTTDGKRIFLNLLMRLLVGN